MSSSTIFAGLFGSFAISLGALVLAPQAQLGKLQPAFEKNDLQYSGMYPVVSGIADQGREIYVEQGCYTCHSQEVRDEQNGSDIKRGWGSRRTVARDYLYDSPNVLGYSRLGPDLSNVGAKNWRNEPADDTRRPAKRDAAWHYLHLYEPRTIITESNHPPYRFLFEERPISGSQAADAVVVTTGKHVPKPGYQIVPKPEARALVAYLLTLDRTFELPEAKPPAPVGGAPALPAPTGVGTAPVPGVAAPNPSAPPAGK